MPEELPEISPLHSSRPARRSAVYFLMCAFLPVEIGLVYFTPRSDFPWLITFYLLLFVLYMGILRFAHPEKDHKFLMAGGIIFRAVLLFSVPELSDDFYRFIWDGMMGQWGFDPFVIVPEEHLDSLTYKQQQWTEHIYDKMNSRGYYTVYPPLLQGVFRIAAWASPFSWEMQVPVMKAFILVAEAGSIWVLSKLAREWKLGKKAVWLYALNPLVIVELTGALHFEAFMIFFSLLGVWLLVKNKWYLSAPAFALAVGAKLLPLMFFPFLIRRLGWGKSLGFFILSGVCILLLFFPLLDLEALEGFFGSVRLYFQTFEFNASIYYVMKWIFRADQHYLYAKILSALVAVSIFMMAFLEKRPGSPKTKPFSRPWMLERFTPLPIDPKLLQGMLLALTLYLLSATTIHPWYLVSLVAFGALTRFRFPILWGVLILFTYITYLTTDYEQSTAVMLVEYGLVYSYLAYEWLFKSREITLEDFAYRIPFLKRAIAKSIPKRVEIKIGHLLPHLTKEEKALDIGTGNGGICHALLAEGRNVQPLDIKDISFFPEVRPLIYDGTTLPFKDDSFDAALLITMLHHTPDPEAILMEALRVAPKLIIMEDIYTNVFQKHLTFFTDSLVNLEFEGHPHTNRNDAGWKQLFEALNLELISVEYRRTLVFFKQVVYVVRKKV